MDADTLPYPAAETKCTHEHCGRSAWRSCPKGFCLFHSPHNGRRDETARVVWHTARMMAMNQAAKKADFRGWHFPPDPEYEPGSADGGFCKIEFAAAACFPCATFSGDAPFVHTVFSKLVSFDQATFSRSANFSVATFSGPADFNGATFSGPACFNHVRFSEHADFNDVTLSNRAQFHGTRFGDEAMFRGINWARGCDVVVDLPYRRWSESQRFRQLRKVTEALGFAELIGCPGPFRHRRHGARLYRLAKQTSQERGDYTSAGLYHYAEQCAIEDRRRHESGHRPWRRAFWFWLGRLLFGRIVFGYGERPWHPLLVGLAVILAWTGLYLHLDAIGPDNPLDPAAVECHEPSVAEALYFSVVTFTTLGYGDFQPKARYRVLASVEAVLGAALLATFVVCLTRKYMR